MSEKEKKEGFSFDLGDGQIGLGGIFKGIEKLIELASNLEESGGEANREGEFDLGHLKKGMKGVYGFSIKSALGGRGKPVVESFGNIKKPRRGRRLMRKGNRLLMSSMKMMRSRFTLRCRE